MMPRDELLSTAQVCAELGVARSTLYRWRRSGDIASGMKLPNGSIRIRRSEVDRFLAKCGKRH